VPSYADHWSGPDPTSARIEVGGVPWEPGVDVPVGPDDRVLVAVDAAEPTGLALLLGVLRSGAALVLVPDPESVDLAAVVADEAVTATAGLAVDGLPRLG
jgi:hypothetical protein